MSCPGFCDAVAVGVPAAIAISRRSVAAGRATVSVRCEDLAAGSCARHRDGYAPIMVAGRRAENTLTLLKRVAAEEVAGHVERGALPESSARLYFARIYAATQRDEVQEVRDDLPKDFRVLSREEIKQAYKRALYVCLAAGVSLAGLFTYQFARAEQAEDQLKQRQTSMGDATDGLARSGASLQNAAHPAGHPAARPAGAPSAVRPTSIAVPAQTLGQVAWRAPHSSTPASARTETSRSLTRG